MNLRVQSRFCRQCWSVPAARNESTRRGLRGESLAEDDLEQLRLPEDPPDAGQVLSAVAALLRFQMPIVLGCDQLEAVLVAASAQASRSSGR
jgi:hypothetical protein